MSQYLLLIHGNAKSQATPEEWEAFFTAAQQSGHFKGGSELGDRIMVGDSGSAKASDHLVGFMRFDAEDRQAILDLLQQHPVVIHGGSVELCEMPTS